MPLQAAPPRTSEDLEALRARLDRIDELLLDRVRDRIRVCQEIAGVKRRQQVAMMAPQRIAVVHQRAARYGQRNGIDEDFLRRLYDLIIEETCRVETLVIDQAPEV